jgi:hypothetical protein
MKKFKTEVGQKNYPFLALKYSFGVQPLAFLKAV